MTPPDDQSQRNPYYPGARFQPASESRPIVSPYDIMTPEFVDLQKRDIIPFSNVRIDVSQAGSQTLSVPCRGFTGFIENAAGPLPLARVNVRVNKDSADQAFPLRNGRGYYGDVLVLFLEWQAQGAGATLELILFNFNAQPYPCVG